MSARKTNVPAIPPAGGTLAELQRTVGALKEAVEVLSRFPKAKFDETVELAFRLGVDPTQGDQMAVRSSSGLRRMSFPGR